MSRDCHIPNGLTSSSSVNEVSFNCKMYISFLELQERWARSITPPSAETYHIICKSAREVD